MTPGGHRMRLGWVILTMGTRHRQLMEAIESVFAQDVAGEVLVVAQGVDIDVPPAVSVLRLDANVGIPAGRDEGMRAIDADVVFFLDDDARYVDSAACRRVLDAMARRPELAAVSLHLTDEDGVTLQRHVPRLGKGSADTSGDVTTFLGGACAVRRDAYLAVRGYHADFFYGHEELDLAWRLLDSGMAIAYDAAPAVAHPHTVISEVDPDRWRMLARNRVWLARRRLPHPIDWLHAAVWLVAGLLRADAPADRTSYRRGWRAAWKDPIERAPVSWGTVLRMTRLGRPPIV